MVSKQPACETCRKSKLACDHDRPACTRCRKSDKADTCVYRASPFKRQRHEALSPVGNTSPHMQQIQLEAQLPVLAQAKTIAPSHSPYPNPGYAGSSSHVAIFNRIPGVESQSSVNNSPGDGDVISSGRQSSEAELLVKQAAQMTKTFFDAFKVHDLKSFIRFWHAKGINLALAGSFVSDTVTSMDYLQSLIAVDKNWHTTYGSLLLCNTSQPLDIENHATISSFSAQFLGQKTRWETFGLFLSAIIRATIDISFFPSLFTTTEERIRLRELATKLSDQCLDICLSLDMLNDLQLIFQYENFIVHSNVNGDQSYQSWRRLGDVITSVLALGHHERIESTPNTPLFLIELRKAAFARIYSADKNVALFLGRPPRLSRRFCHFRIPCYGCDSLAPSTNSSAMYIWKSDASINYLADTCWTAICAVLKEEIIELFYGERQADDLRQVESIQARAESEWQSLPTHFKLMGNLSSCTTTSPFERDFLVSTRLHYLHILFLLRLVLSSRSTEPDASAIEISQEIVGHVVEAVLLRDQLANSGTTLHWKIALYGLPAAGVLLLALIKPRGTSEISPASRIQIVQDLTVLVAELQRGTVIRPGEPNYALFSKASDTIQRVLQAINLEQARAMPPITAPVENSQTFNDTYGMPGFGPDPWDFEMGFWQSLGDHPLLSSIDATSNGTWNP